ncbi:MAG: endonuclease III [Coriobacteriales bacterium]|nr:endonuclease III [Coriobacteriales bacterium]
MPVETKEAKIKRATQACEIIKKVYPKAKASLNFTNAYECVIAVSLSAQTTDAAVNKVTPRFFKMWPNSKALSRANLKDVQSCISTIGFYQNKAKYVINCAKMLESDFNGQVPNTYEDLQKLPGVGRKTANIVLNEIFGIYTGIAVDTHVNRISHKLYLVPQDLKDATKVEKKLLEIIPKNFWKDVNKTWILFGREYCNALTPHCEICPLARICPSNIYR